MWSFAETFFFFFFFYMSMDTFKPIVPKMFPQIHHVLEMKFQINITGKKKRKMEVNTRDRGTLGIEYVVFSLSGAARRKK